MELLEYFDEKNEKSLGIAERDYIHKNNFWHREVAVWVLNEKNELLLQRRSSKKKQGANKFSITAGHIDVKEEATIAAMQEQLAQKDQEIAGLNTKVDVLNENLNVANMKNEEQSRLIADQIVEMNKVYYIGASKKEVKEKGILTSKYILRQEVPADAFTKADKRELTEIVFETKKAKVLSAHPTESYTIVLKDNQSVLQITNPELFWSVTKYLVVVTK